jgi:hypothetical protein
MKTLVARLTHPQAALRPQWFEILPAAAAPGAAAAAAAVPSKPSVVQRSERSTAETERPSRGKRTVSWSADLEHPMERIGDEGGLLAAAAASPSMEASQPSKRVHKA